MDLYLISVLVFVVIIAILVYADRKNFKRDSFLLLRRTKKGKKFLEDVGRSHSRFWNFLGSIGVIVGFAASIYGFYFLIDTLIKNFSTIGFRMGLVFLLPSPSPSISLGPGYFAVPFWHWIIAIALLALVHEGFHGIMAVAGKVKIKSLGFGLLAIIPLAFVEPDEKQLSKKSAWTQLRVYTAGSFSNFILGALCIIILIYFTALAFTQVGVYYQDYIKTQINVGDIKSIDNRTLNDFRYIINELNQNKTVEILANNKTYISTVGLLKAQLASGFNTIIVYENYPAVRARMSGIITRINDKKIKNVQDLSDAMEEVGPNKLIKVYTNDSGKERMYLLTTKEMPKSEKFEPNSQQIILMEMENVFPGTIDLIKSFSDFFDSVLMKEKVVSWRSLKSEMDFWIYVRENYPRLRQEAEEKIVKIESELAKHSKPGFLGIANFATFVEVNQNLKFAEEQIKFLSNLFFILFIINIGVGVANLLPWKPFDGGKMWETVFMKISKKHAKKISDILTYITLFMVIVGFGMQFI